MLRIIGDVHGLVNRFPRRAYLSKEASDENRTYMKVIADAEYTIQLGDMGWREDLEIMKNVNPDNHKIIYGNHDDYDNLLPHYLGDYGIAKHAGITFGFVRGELSVDKHFREHFGPRKSWWDQEELTHQQSNDMLDFFSSQEPVDFMFSHGCPHTIYDEGVLTNPGKYDPSFTAKMLSALNSFWKPKYWMFGHHHNNWRYNDGYTQFICLNELCYVDIDDNGNVSQNF